MAKCYFAGLENSGNACYLNCAVQSLSATYYFSDFLDIHCSEYFPVCRSLRNLSCELQAAREAPQTLSCHELRHALASGHNWSLEDNQQDCHEAFLLLFEAILKEILISKDNFGVLCKNDARSCRFHLPEVRHFVTHGVVAKVPFVSLMVSKMTCLECNTVRKPWNVEYSFLISLYPSFSSSFQNRSTILSRFILKVN